MLRGYFVGRDRDDNTIIGLTDVDGTYKDNELSTILLGQNNLLTWNYIETVLHPDIIDWTDMVWITAVFDE